MLRSRNARLAVRSFLGDARGSISIIAAAGLVFVLATSALAIDLGMIHVERRQYQGAVDLAAMAASTDLSHAAAAAEATLAANGIVTSGTGRITVETGHYASDSALSPKLRFRPGLAPTNAVRVTLTAPSKTFFARYFTQQSFNLTVSAVASCDNLAAFSIGSRLLNISGGVPNALLGVLLGSNVQLTAMDYNALANFNVDLFPFMDALASDLNFRAGTYSDVLQSNATVGNVLDALAHIADTTVDVRSSSALSSLIAGGGSQEKIDLSTLVALGPLGGLSIGSQPAGLVASINALQLVGGAATLAGGQRQASVDLTAAVPGLMSLKADIAIGQPIQHAPYSAVGSEGAIVRTSQTRIRIVAQIGGTGLLAGTTIRLPIVLDIASAEARLSDIRCGFNGTGSVDLAVTPGVAQAWIGDTPNDLTNFGSSLSVQSAKLVDVTLAKIYGKAEVDAGSTSATMLTFDPPDIGSGTIKQASTNTLAQGVVTSLLRNLSLSAQVGPLGVGLGSQLNTLVLSRLNAFAAPLDSVIDGVLSALGVKLGQADVLVDGIRCRGNGMLSG